MTDQRCWGVWVGRRMYLGVLGGRGGGWLSKQLLVPSSAASFPSLLLLLLHLAAKSWIEIKGGQHERLPWDSVFFSFLCALSPCSLCYRYGNSKFQIHLLPRLQRMPGFIRLLSFLSLFLSSASSRPLHHHLSPSPALASLQQPSGIQVDSGWLAAAVTVSGTSWEWMSVSLAPGA